MQAPDPAQDGADAVQDILDALTERRTVLYVTMFKWMGEEFEPAHLTVCRSLATARLHARDALHMFGPTELSEDNLRSMCKQLEAPVRHGTITASLDDTLIVHIAPYPVL